MPIVADHNLLPHQADWMKLPTIQRIWRAGVDTDLSGNEDRLTVRGAAWLQLAYQVLPYNNTERLRLEARFKASLRDGHIAVPHWGRGIPITEVANQGATALVLERSATWFVAGKYGLIQSRIPADFEEWDLILIQSVSGKTLNIASGLDFSYPRGTRVWPLLFGRPIPNQFNIMSRHRGRYQIEVLFDQRQINAFSEDDFEAYALGEITSPLNSGQGWAGAWVIDDMAA